MKKITASVVHVGAASGPGYDVTHSLYCQGDRSPCEVHRYESLSHAEMLNVVEAILTAERPGWAYAEFFAQPPMFGQD